MSSRAPDVGRRKSGGDYSGTTTLLMTGCLAGIAVRGAIPPGVALALCGAFGLGTLVLVSARKLTSRLNQRSRQMAREQSLARIAHRIDRHIPRGALRPAAPHHARKLPERQFMTIAQSARRMPSHVRD